jgi:hypothetical protein
MAAVKEAVGEPDWKSIIKFKHLESEPKSKNPSVEQKEENTMISESQPNGDDAPESRAPTTRRVVTKSHFEHALEEILPSFSDKARAEMNRWDSANGASTPGRKKGPATARN